MDSPLYSHQCYIHSLKSDLCGTFVTLRDVPLCSASCCPGQEKGKPTVLGLHRKESTLGPFWELSARHQSTKQGRVGAWGRSSRWHREQQGPAGALWLPQLLCSGRKRSVKGSGAEHASSVWEHVPWDSQTRNLSVPVLGWAGWSSRGSSAVPHRALSAWGALAHLENRNKKLQMKWNLIKCVTQGVCASVVCVRVLGQEPGEQLWQEMGHLFCPHPWKSAPSSSGKKSSGSVYPFRVQG